ncbi:MAG: amidohydrolase [Oscillospiraceae bacterium]|nr:amidohydrolase [Oscillospiraceae bacterium]
MDALKQQALDMQEELTALRRDFHMHPELGGREYRTAARIEEELDTLGIAHRRVGETGILATVRGTGKGGGAVALRADIDALPITERSRAPYRSQNDGVMHACGHDAHTACLLGAAKLLAGNRALFGGEARLAFQPAEECGNTPPDFIAAGFLDGVTRVFGLHCAPDLPSDTVGIKPGPNNAGVDRFSITVHGLSTHVATPHLGVDALYIAAQTVVALQALATRRSDPVEPVLLGVGTIRAGTAYNALAETAVLEGTTRTVTRETRQRMREQITALATETARLYGGTAELVWEGLAPPLLNDPAAAAEAAALVREMWREKRVVTDRAISLTGDDFAEFTTETPGVYAYLGTGDPAREETRHNIHSADFDIDERALPFGAWFHAAIAIRWLTRQNG